MQIFIAMLIDPILIVGLILMFWERVRSNYIVTFLVVAALHSGIMMMNPLKDSFFYNALIMRLGVDAIVLLGIGYLLKRSSGNR